GGEPAQELVLPPVSEQEGDALDDVLAVSAERDLVAPGAMARDDDRAAAPHATLKRGRELSRDAVQHRDQRRPETRAVRLREREDRHGDELAGRPGGGDGARRAAEMPVLRVGEAGLGCGGTTQHRYGALAAPAPDEQRSDGEQERRFARPEP